MKIKTNLCGKTRKTKQNNRNAIRNAQDAAFEHPTADIPPATAHTFESIAGVFKVTHTHTRARICTRAHVP